MLEIEAETPIERNRIANMPPVGRHARARSGALRHRHSPIRTFADPQAPSVIKIILRAGSFDARLLLSINVEAVVAFSKPARFGLNHVQQCPHIMPSAAH